MRLFIAVSLPAPVRAAIEAALAPHRQAFDDVRWTDRDALHVTIKFLGTVDDGAVDGIVTALDRCAAGHEEFDIRLAGVGVFPGPRRPQVLWVGVDDGGALRALATELDAALAPLGFARDVRPFTPHVTVGRVRARRGSARAQRHADLPAYDIQASVHVETIDLMQSHLGRGGARHERLHPARLEAERA